RGLALVRRSTMPPPPGSAITCHTSASDQSCERASSGRSPAPFFSEAAGGGAGLSDFSAGLSDFSDFSGLSSLLCALARLVGANHRAARTSSERRTHSR